MHPLVRIIFVGFILALSISANSSATEIDFSLIDQKGKTFHLHDLRGKVVMVFFGYTHCPDVCPLELQHVSTALKQLGEKAVDVRGLFVTVDPEQDTPGVIAEYLSYFGGGLIGLTGSKAQIDAAASQFRVKYQKNHYSSSQYTMEHTANLYVVDQTGQLSTIVPFGFPAAHIKALVRDLLAAAK